MQYPTEPCEAEVYGSYCLVSGTQSQGDFCSSPTDCTAGFVCVVSGAGNAMRSPLLPDRPLVLPDGQVCEPIDVAGYGGCI